MRHQRNIITKCNAWTLIKSWFEKNCCKTCLGRILICLAIEYVCECIFYLPTCVNGYYGYVGVLPPPFFKELYLKSI